MKFFEKLKETFDLIRRLREAEGMVDELLELNEIKDHRIEQYELRLEEMREDCDKAIGEVEKARMEAVEWRMQCELNMELCRMVKERPSLEEAYARLKVDADVMRQEIKEYRRKLFDKEQGNAGNDLGQ